MGLDRQPTADPGLPMPVWDNRQFHRVPCDVPANLLSTALGRVRATVVDLSQSGCRITTRAKCRVGNHFVLKIDPMGPKLVTVVWVDGETVGLVFAEIIGWSAISQIVFGGPVEQS